MIDFIAVTPAYCSVSEGQRSVALLDKSLRAAGWAAASMLFMTTNLIAQQVSATRPEPSVLLATAGVSGVVDELPNAPDSLNLAIRLDLASAAVSSSNNPDAPAGAHDTVHGARMAGPYTKYIEPGEQVPRLTVRDKAILGLKDAVSPFSMVAWVTSAGYAQGLNNSPNYGQNAAKSFAQRLGASALRDFTEGTFGDSVIAPLLHEDPRYYRMGKSHPFLKRLVYAGTRGLITRTDSGHSTVNIANIGGNLGGSFLTDAYYPARNTTFSETMETFGTGVGGSALGFAVSEFLPDIFHAFHLPAPGY